MNKTTKENYREYLFNLMGSEFLNNSKNKDHPCYIDYWALQEGYIYPKNCTDLDSWQKKQTERASIAFLHAATFSIVSQEIGSQINDIGDFSSLASESIKSEMHSRIGAKKERANKRARPKSETAYSVISEFFVAAWLHQNKQQLKYIQEDGLPDFYIDSLQIAIECKAYINADSLENCIENHCSKAKRQLINGRKKWGDSLLGIVVIDLSRYLSNDINENNSTFNDNIESLIKRSIFNRAEIDWVLYFYDTQTTTISSSYIYRKSKWVKGFSPCSSIAPLDKYQLFLATGSERIEPPTISLSITFQNLPPVRLQGVLMGHGKYFCQ